LKKREKKGKKKEGTENEREKEEDWLDNCHGLLTALQLLA